MNFLQLTTAMLLTLALNTHAAESICYGTTAHGRIGGSVKLPSSGKNFNAYSQLGSQLGRTYVHSVVQKIVLRAYEQLRITSPLKTFVYGETGLVKGGVFKPHRSHQNGLSVDFMVPVLQDDGRSVPLPTNIMNKFGYGMEFDAQGKFENLSIDFEAMGEHLYQLDITARQAGIEIDRVIFEPQFHSKLFATKRGFYIKSHLHFMTHQAWIRHDEHYHVDFKVACKT
jgi:penicillin-insensitive murein DD-endopeptidase